MENKEFSLEELDNILGGISRETGIEKAKENPALYRQKKIDELKQQRNAIVTSEEYREAHANTQSGRSK